MDSSFPVGLTSMEKKQYVLQQLLKVGRKYDDLKCTETKSLFFVSKRTAINDYTEKRLDELREELGVERQQSEVAKTKIDKHLHRTFCYNIFTHEEYWEMGDQTQILPYVKEQLEFQYLNHQNKINKISEIFSLFDELGEIYLDFQCDNKFSGAETIQTPTLQAPNLSIQEVTYNKFVEIASRYERDNKRLVKSKIYEEIADEEKCNVDRIKQRVSREIEKREMKKLAQKKNSRILNSDKE